MPAGTAPHNQVIPFVPKENAHHFPSQTYKLEKSQLATFSLAFAPLALCHTSPPHLISRSAAAVGPSTAGRTSRENTGAPVGSGTE